MKLRQVLRSEHEASPGGGMENLPRSRKLKGIAS